MSAGGEYGMSTPQSWRSGRWCFRDAAGLALTSEAIRIMAFAELEAALLGHSALGAQHVLASLLENDDGLTAAAFVGAGARLAAVHNALSKAAAPIPPPQTEGLVLGADTHTMLAVAGELARGRGDDCVVARDLLHAVLGSRTVAALVFADLDVAVTDVHEHLKRILAGIDA